MAYRRRHGITRTSTFKEEIHHPPEQDNHHENINKNTNINDDTFLITSSSSSSLAAQAIRASAAHRESSLSSAYAGDSIPRRSKVFFMSFFFVLSRTQFRSFVSVSFRIFICQK
jgi:hypothetical protein